MANHKENDCQSARPQRTGLSEDHRIWDGILARLEHGSLDLRRKKPPKGQIPNARSPRDGTSKEFSHEGWGKQDFFVEGMSATGLDQTGEDQWRSKLWKARPPGWSQGDALKG